MGYYIGQKETVTIALVDMKYLPLELLTLYRGGHTGKWEPQRPVST